MRTLETDYLVVGAGAMGMAFTDALIDHADVRGRPGRPASRARAATGTGRVPLRPAPSGLACSTAWPRPSSAPERIQRGRPGGRPARAGSSGGDPGLLRRRSCTVGSSDPVGCGSCPGASTRGDALDPGGHLACLGRARRGSSQTAGSSTPPTSRRACPPRPAPPFGVADGACQWCLWARLADAGGGTERVRDRRIGQDGNRRHRVVGAQRRGAGSHHLGPPARPLDVEPGIRPARSGGGLRPGGRHHGGRHRSRVDR